MVDAPKQEWRDGWTACVGSDLFRVKLTRRWSTMWPLTIAEKAGRAALGLPSEHSDRWEASCEMALERFADECPTWIIEIEGSRKAARIWKTLCDAVSDELGLLAQQEERDYLSVQAIRTDANAPSTITHGDPHGD